MEFFGGTPLPYFLFLPSFHSLLVKYTARVLRFRRITSAIRFEDTNGATPSQRTLYVPDTHTARAELA